MTRVRTTRREGAESPCLSAIPRDRRARAEPWLPCRRGPSRRPPRTPARSTRRRPSGSSRRPRTRPMRAGASRRARSSATRTCTRRFSMDAGAFGARLGPRDAYRFAKGEEIMASSGQRVKLSRPLDFLVVADHSDNMGFFPQLFAGDPEDAGRPDRPPLVRHDPGGQGGGRRARDHRRVLPGDVPQGAQCPSRHAGLPLGLARDDQGGRRGERPGPLHRLHRLRVDLEHRRQQPASQRASSATTARRRSQVEPFTV